MHHLAVRPMPPAPHPALPASGQLVPETSMRRGRRTCRQPASGCRSAHRPGRCPAHKCSVVSTSRAGGSVETALRTFCHGSFLCSWTVHRAQSACKGQSSVRATSGEACPATLTVGHGAGEKVLTRQRAVWCSDVPRPGVHTLPLHFGSEEASGGSPSPFLSTPTLRKGGNRRVGKMGRTWGRRRTKSPHPYSRSQQTPGCARGYVQSFQDRTTVLAEQLWFFFLYLNPYTDIPVDLHAGHSLSP